MPPCIKNNVCWLLKFSIWNEISFIKLENWQRFGNNEYLNQPTTLLCETWEQTVTDNGAKDAADAHSAK